MRCTRKEIHPPQTQTLYIEPPLPAPSHQSHISLNHRPSQLTIHPSLSPMDYGHHGHHHHDGRDDEPEPHYGRPGYAPPPPEFGRPGYAPPPPEFGRPGYAPPPPPEFGLPGYAPPPEAHHMPPEFGCPGYAPPPPPEAHHMPPEFGRPGYAPPPPPEVHHVPPEFGHHGHHHNPFPFPSHSSTVEHVSHEPGRPAAPATRQPTVRIYCKADETHSLSIREGKVILAKANPRDEYQHWIKDLRYSTKVKDEEALPSFALVNKVTGQAIKHAIGKEHPVRLVKYNPDYLDESLLWTESKDTGENYRCIRMVNNIRLNFDAFHGDDDHGGVHDGTEVYLWEWLKGKNQRWKIVPY